MRKILLLSFAMTLLAVLFNLSLREPSTNQSQIIATVQKENLKVSKSLQGEVEPSQEGIISPRSTLIKEKINEEIQQPKMYSENFPELSSPEQFYRGRDFSSVERQRAIMKSSGYDIWEYRALPIYKIKAGDLISFENGVGLEAFLELLRTNKDKLLFFLKGKSTDQLMATQTLPACSLKIRNDSQLDSFESFVNMPVESVTYPIKINQFEGIEIQFKKRKNLSQPIESISCFLKSRAASQTALDQILFIHLLLTIGLEGRILVIQ